MVHKAFLLWGSRLDEVSFMIASHLKILGLYLLKVYWLMFLFPLVLNVGNITENFSKKIYLANAMDGEKQRGIGCNISLQIQSWQIFIEKMHSTFLVPRATVSSYLGPL